MSFFKAIRCIVLCIAVACGPLYAADINSFETDSITTTQGNRPLTLHFQPTQLIVPAGLITVGIAGCYWGSFKRLNRSVNKELQNWSGGHKLHIDDWLQYVPAAGYLALGFYNSKRKLDFKERISVEMTAFLCTTLLVNVTKYSIKEPRPSGYKNSFPSGHTAVAFTGAELIRREFGWGIGSAAYAVATGVAFLRLYNNCHWLNDVIGGAGIGILSAHVGYWLLPVYRKWFHWSTGLTESSLTFMPSFDGKAFAMNLVCRL